jgi:hypothetical protein
MIEKIWYTIFRNYKPKYYLWYRYSCDNTRSTPRFKIECINNLATRGNTLPFSMCIWKCGHTQYYISFRYTACELYLSGYIFFFFFSYLEKLGPPACVSHHNYSDPCLEWESNPLSQCLWREDSSCLRPRSHCDRLHDMPGLLLLLLRSELAHAAKLLNVIRVVVPCSNTVRDTEYI